MGLSLLEELALLSDAEQAEVLRDFDGATLALLASAWEVTARPEQLPPAWPWDYWLLIGGRGSGKTRPSAELVNQWAADPLYIALVGETAAEVRDVMVEGPSGLLATAWPANPARYLPSKRRVVWASGAWGTTFSGDSPDQLRGPNAAKAWVDELAKFKFPQATWDNLEMILRAGDQPQAVVSTTPRPIPLLKALLADAQPHNPAGHNALTRFSTYANLANLAPSFIARVVRKYEGTRLGRQELHAELLDDTPGALWTLGLIEGLRVRQTPTLTRVVVAVDPHASVGESGIVVAGIGPLGQAIHGFVLDDLTTGGSPATWAGQAVTAYYKHRADRIIAETNNGGDMVIHTLQSVDPTVPTKKIWASRGKRTRAEPVAALYEKGRVHHVGMFADLEDELCNWVPGESEESPNRLDSLVWALTELMVEADKPAGSWR